MQKVYITGSSKGLGKALAEAYLKQGATVVGMSRSATIQHSNYTHIKIDLSNARAVEEFQFIADADCDSLILINNAGTLGDVKHIGEIENSNIAKSIQLNVVAPMVLTNKLTAVQCNKSCKKRVLNIGSGASTNAIDGWGIYCTSKAALNMYNNVFDAESEKKPKNTLMRTVAPGIVDTAMQEEIRKSDEEHFYDKERFIQYKRQNELASADEVAAKIIRNFEPIFKNKETVQRISHY